MSLSGITTYNPDILRLRNNLNSIVTQVDKIIIFDNHSSNLNEIQNLTNHYSGRVSLYSSSTNVGVAAALNAMLAVAQNQHEPWILFLDQDSKPELNLYRKLSAHVEPNTAILSPLVEDINRKHQDANKHEIEPFMWPITSGSLVNVDVCKKLGSFNERLFIDFVDDDYSIRVFLSGYKSYRVNDAILTHEIGRLTPSGIPFPHIEGGRIVWRRAFNSGHSPSRHYYQVRNLCYLRQRYGKSLAKRDVKLPSVLKFYLHSIIFENNRIANIKAMNKGFADYGNLL
ncbi:MAG: glycosyltransferase [Bifidobacterium sp.]|nr:glycosyltransferase [Bifidobacterium sp.]